MASNIESDDPPPHRMYRHPDAAAYLGMTERQLTDARMSGDITWAKPGKYVVLRQDWLDDFLAPHIHERRSDS